MFLLVQFNFTSKVKLKKRKINHKDSKTLRTQREDYRTIVLVEQSEESDFNVDKRLKYARIIASKGIK